MWYPHLHGASDSNNLLNFREEEKKDYYIVAIDRVSLHAHNIILRLNSIHILFYPFGLYMAVYYAY